jgi:bifunctional non-homologous end joining protein LigD
MAPEHDALHAYRRKRDFAATSEPDVAAPAPDAAGAPRFVIQQHDASRLHWDLRLEHDGTLASWALPRGIPLDPHDDRLAVRTEDHPLEYLTFHGEIPAGSYGAGAMEIFDHGTYEPHLWSERKVEVTLRGERVDGRYGLHPVGRGGGDGEPWRIHRMGPASDPQREPLPQHLPPMLARPGELPAPAEDERWGYEVKWDGVRALLWSDFGQVRVENRSQREITDRYPELRPLGRTLGAHQLLLDGELVVLDAAGRPSFEALQQRMHVTGEAAVRRLARSHPVTYAIFDLLHVDGRSLLELPYGERRERLDALALEGPAWRAPRAYRGGGAALVAATREQGLEGVVAKRLDSRYEPGRRSGAWRKLPNRLREQLAIGGWTEGEAGRAGRIGALLLGVRERPGGPLRYAGRVGSGFTDATLDELAARLEPLRRTRSPFAKGAAAPPKGARYVAPQLVAEVEFGAWTREGLVRQAAFKRLCDDADPFEGRAPRFTNRDKVLFPAAGFTKGDLIDYYVAIAPTLLPHLRDRPLTLRRWPDGVEGKTFYEKQAPSHRPEWVQTTSIWSRGENRRIDYVLAQDAATLAWTANLAAIELHPSLSLARDMTRPTAVVFDLDPGPPAGLPECAEVALVLAELFERLGLASAVKTSGGKGLQVYVPLGEGVATYERTKAFARQVAELLARRLPELVVARQARELRAGRVLVDWSQNDEHKTTVAAYSVRARERPLVSTPLSWEELRAAHAAGAADELAFDTAAVLARVAEQGDLLAPLLGVRQELPDL